MRFTLWTIGAPGALAILAAVLSIGNPHSLLLGSAGALAGLVLLFTVPLNCVYWLVRLVRYAWRHDEQPAAQAPAAREGKIFGL